MRDRLDQILERLESIVDNKKTDEETSEEIRTIINLTEELFSDLDYTIDELKDEICMYQDNIDLYNRRSDYDNYF